MEAGLNPGSNIFPLAGNPIIGSLTVGDNNFHLLLNDGSFPYTVCWCCTECHKLQVVCVLMTDFIGKQHYLVILMNHFIHKTVKF